MKITNSKEIPGLYEVELDVFEDERGSFREVYNQEKLTTLGAQVIKIVQQNISANLEIGVTRGIHAEPWNKLVTMAKGSAYGAWVDLREGSNLGNIHTAILDEGRVVFVPKGVGNSYQTLEPDTRYSYLTDSHWSSEATYTMLNIADPEVKIDWPIPLDEAVISQKDHNHPFFSELRKTRGNK